MQSLITLSKIAIPTIKFIFNIAYYMGPKYAASLYCITLIFNFL